MYTAFLLTLLICIAGSLTLYMINCLLHARQTRRAIDLSNPIIEISLTEEVEYKRVLFWKMRVKKELPPVPANYELNPAPAGNWMIDDEPKNCQTCVFSKFDDSLEKELNEKWYNNKSSRDRLADWDKFWEEQNKARNNYFCLRPRSADADNNIQYHIDIETNSKELCGYGRKYHALPIHPGQKSLQEIYQ